VIRDVKSTLLALTFGLALLPVGALGQGPLTLDDCIRLATASASALNAARHQSEIASLGVSQARSALLPQARANAAFAYNSPTAVGGDAPSFVALNGAREWSALFTVVQELDTSGRLRASQARARADRDAAAASLGLTERDLRRQVTGAYYRVILARRLAQAARDALAESRAFEARTRLRFDKGEAARADVVKAAAETALVEQSTSAADLEAELASHELASFWTTDVAAPLALVDVLDDPLPDPPAPALVLAAGERIARRPELSLLDAQRRGFLAEATRERAERRPQASVTLQYGLDSLHLRWGDRGYAAFFGLDIPVFDWFKGRGAARQFELQAGQVEVSRKIAERAFSREYQDALSRARMIHGQITATRAQVQLSEENLRLSRLRYDGGEGSALDVVAAQNQLAQARTNHYTALVRYLASWADLKVASGE
jgi:outer membrane protein TolC